MTRVVGVLSLDNQDLQTDARVQRQIRCLSKKFDVRVITYASEVGQLNLPTKHLKIVGSLSKRKWIRRIHTLFLLSLGRLFGPAFYEIWYWRRPGHKEAASLLEEWQVDIIQANDWWTLPAAVKAAKRTGARIVLDLHEYSLDEYSSRFWRFFYNPTVHYFFRKYIHHADAVLTVNQMLADRYAGELNISPFVIRNIPETSSVPSFQRVNPQKIGLVHQGYAQRARQLEKMIDVVAACDSRYHLTFILVGDQKYISDLKEYAQKAAPGKVDFLPGVEPKELIGLIKQFDMGIFLTQSQHFSILASLPNKFFEFISAGLAVCIGPSPAMAEIVKTYSLGVVANSFDPAVVADVLNGLSAEKIEEMKRKAIEAQAFLNSELEMDKLLKIYDNLPERKLVDEIHNS